MRIGNMELGPGAALAPLAGVTDQAMRSLCAEYGAVFTVSEMVSIKAIVMNDRKSLALLKRHPECGGPAQATLGTEVPRGGPCDASGSPSQREGSARSAPPAASRPAGAPSLGTPGGPPDASGSPSQREGSARSAPPYGVQLFGNEPDTMAEAVRRIAGEDCDFIDLNYGCPAPKIATHGNGAGLLRNPPLAGALAEAAVKAAGPRPVTAKLRIGWDEDEMTGLEVAKRLEAAGVQLLAVHGRTRAQQYTPGVNHGAVAAIKAAVKVPVLFNGDIDSPAAALAAIERTGCNGVMIGRAALGNPFLFAQVRAALAGGEPPAPPTLRQRLAVMERQIRAMCEEKGEERAMREARKVAAGYLRGLQGAASLRRLAHSLAYFTDLAALQQAAYTYNTGG